MENTVIGFTGGIAKHTGKKQATYAGICQVVQLKQPCETTVESHAQRTYLLHSAIFSLIAMLQKITLKNAGFHPLSTQPSDLIIPVIKILPWMPFVPIPDPDPRKAYGPEEVPPIVPRNYTLVITPCPVKLPRLYLLTFAFHSSWKFAYIQPVSKKEQ